MTVFNLCRLLSSSFFSFDIFFWQSCFGSSSLPSNKHYLRCDCSISILIEKGKRFAEFRDLQRINSEKYFCKMIERFPATSSFCHNWTRTNSQNWFWKYFARFSWCKRNFHRNKNSSTLCFKILLIISRKILISHNLRQCMVPYLNLDISFLFETWTLFSFVVQLAKIKRT